MPTLRRVIMTHLVPSSFTITPTDDDASSTAGSSSSNAYHSSDSNSDSNEPLHSCQDLATLQKQERTHCKPPHDYLQQLYKEYTILLQQQQHTNATTPNKKFVDPICREKMCQWCLGISQACDFQLETVFVAMSCLDNLLSQHPHKYGKDRHVFQLASMTCLYIAAKLYEPKALSTRQIAMVSQGKFSESQLETMEVEILFGLNWKLHPITPQAYWNLMLEHNDANNNNNIELLRVAELQIKLALPDYAFVMVSSEILAYCTLVNAYNYLAITISAQDDSLRFQRNMQKALGWNDHAAKDDSMILETGQRLWALLLQSENRVPLHTNRRIGKLSFPKSSALPPSSSSSPSNQKILHRESPRCIWETTAVAAN